MDKIAFLIFELNKTCNMADEHETCPINLKDRYGNLPKKKRMTDRIVFDAINYAYANGFHGHVAFHYYNEPLLAISRIVPLIECVREHNPFAKFCLWTNGTKLKENEDKLKHFEKIVITNYKKENFDWVKKLCADVTVDFWGFDDRAQQKKSDCLTSCWRAYNELIFDYYGNAHICCIDFRGEVELGNLMNDDIKSIVENFQRERELVYGDGQKMSSGAHRFCKTCAMRHKFTIGKP